MAGRENLTADHVIAPVGGGFEHKYVIYILVKARMRDKSSGVASHSVV